MDGENAAHLEKLDKIECGHVPPHSRVHFYNGITGMHNSLGPDCTLKNVQYWIRQDGARWPVSAKAPQPHQQERPFFWSSVPRGKKLEGVFVKWDFSGQKEPRVLRRVNISCSVRWGYPSSVVHHTTHLCKGPSHGRLSLNGSACTLAGWTWSCNGPKPLVGVLATNHTRFRVLGVLTSRKACQCNSGQACPWPDVFPCKEF